jgi:transcriptional regulator of acetoin/glycerol metabolism
MIRPPHPDDVRDELRDYSERRQAAEQAVVDIHLELATLISTARQAGLSIVETARLAGVSRRTIYRTINPV